MNPLYKVFFTLLFFHFAYSTEDFSHNLNHVSPSEIKRYFILGERCSGTNYVFSLVQKNFPSLSPTSDYGHKHFLLWFGAPENEEMMQKLHYSSKHYDLSESEDCLFIFVVRDPYKWLRSFYSTPHHVHPDLLRNSFLHFISHTWKFSETRLPNHEAFGLIDGQNPFTHRPFKNVCELRSYKIRNSLLLGSRVNHFVIAPYEKVRNDPQGFIKYIASNYHLNPSKEFAPIDSYKGLEEEQYKAKKYSSIKRSSLTYINQNLDWELENSLGYSKRQVEKKSQIYIFFRQVECTCRKFIKSLFNEDQTLEKNSKP